MEIRVHGRNMKVGEQLRELAVSKVGRAGRIFGDGASADVEFAAHTNPRVTGERYEVEITAPVAGRVVRVRAAAADNRTALDRASEKFEGKLRKMKERLIQRSRQQHKLLNQESPPAEESSEQGGLHIARVKRFALKPMMPEEAALQMEMLGHSFFFFLNGENDSFGVLYRRKDGSLGLIEPS